ncbi:ROK family protein [Paenibacillus sp. JX-17]|uniref:fructokinase n=1 Tax=Paenibacillus lacisoli TaxID=3064525 RepID=A0ABT9CM51_9BACL|nr:ROK family protein [Paenibacillus sp. JX-17]MDO7908726.1 ROK family protein [Paenibacillus sp. JX-17]
MRIGAIEAGGTKMVCGIGTPEGKIVDRISFPTEHPDITMPKVIAYFKDTKVEAIGIGTFGPINLKAGDRRYGSITTTPKPGWAHYPFLDQLRSQYDIPFGWDTDVNAAAYGESVWGAAKGLQSCMYYTIGTGIGVGIYSGGELVHGLVHPEGGHIPVRRHLADPYPGRCPYHQDCLEGMAAGPAVEDRWGQKAGDLPMDHPAWAIEAYYIAQAVTIAILMNSPEKVILGGGVMQQRQLLPLIQDEVKRSLNGYLQAEEITKRMEAYIVTPGLGQEAGLYGALALGLKAWEESRRNASI